MQIPTSSYYVQINVRIFRDGIARTHTDNGMIPPFSLRHKTFACN